MPGECHSGIHHAHPGNRTAAHPRAARQARRTLSPYCRCIRVSAEKSRPDLVTGTAEILACGSNDFSVTTEHGNPSKPVALIGATVETRLALELERLRKDEIRLDDLTPALQGFLLHGHRLALASVLPEMTRLEVALAQASADAERFYSALFNPRAPIQHGPSFAAVQAIRKEMYSRGTN